MQLCRRLVIHANVELIVVEDAISAPAYIVDEAACVRHRVLVQKGDSLWGKPAVVDTGSGRFARRRTIRVIEQGAILPVVRPSLNSCGGIVNHVT